ncbi:MAG: RNA pseudouridine synthase [Rickettsiales bacterium]
MTPEEIESRLLYRDALMLILNKPAGIAVHPGSSKSDSLEQYFKYLQYGLPNPPSLAHRLDRETSGCLILGRHRKALSKLGKLFEQKKIEKTYWAVTKGIPKETKGRIALPLKKLNEKKGWKMVVSEDGQESITDYQVLGTANSMAWIEFYPRTGRTHQIRVHAASIDCPIVGDWVYGDYVKDEIILHLHARSVTVPLYASKPSIHIDAPPPPHMLQSLSMLGLRENQSVPK